ncbi:hypothetical protein Tamer19_40460 [Cupriavidus sp. TA19]|uniref:DUF2272 domain-containing protein n=1 Tax=unclassified Cupriavidus TaxID=2640874 RepID=UPI000E2E86E5|nr:MULTISPECIES: DUF2272 domain-containing protein [unclassified Cupriavidus]BDB25972.1 DUF2272 domain-containing protein [Cupriavidus sp. P-10]GLC94638.1 hypothetical protein Tamer19_40460 [Cupriavidus sp. TA19]
MFARPSRRRSPQRYAQRFPQRIPQVSPQAICAAAALALLSACTTVSEPARPQARPLPDNERPVTTPGATARERIVEIATQEWSRWGGQVVRLGRDDSACVAYSPVPAPELPPALPEPPEVQPDAQANTGAPPASGTSADTDNQHSQLPRADCLSFPDGTGMEATPLGCTLARRYWGIVGEAPTCRQVTQGAWAWSAVFISWVLRKAGLDEQQFLTGQSHSMYVVDARDGVLTRPAFRIEPVPALPRPGDIICSGRGRERYLEDVGEIGFGTTPMHCDIVVAVDPAARVVRAIGGNVQQSVSLEEIELGDSGRIDGVTNSHMPWVLVMRNNLQ